MPVKRAIPNNDGVYFITFTCYKWINLIEITNGYYLLYQWFDYLKEKGHLIIGYVLMPNHVHLVIAFQHSGKRINTIVGNGKRFIAYGIIKRMKETGKEDLLRQLESGVNKSDKERGKLHEVWEDSFDWKQLFTGDMIVQKLNYTHENPRRGKWSLVENPADYIHSSAKFYATGEQGFYPVTNFMELNDIDLTNNNRRVPQ